jgi:hypothetical protein
MQLELHDRGQKTAVPSAAGCQFDLLVSLMGRSRQRRQRFIKLTARGERGQECWVLLVPHFHVRTRIMNWHRWGRSSEKNRPIHASVVDSPLDVLCNAISIHWISAVSGFIRIVLRPCSATPKSASPLTARRSSPATSAPRRSTPSG